MTSEFTSQRFDEASAAWRANKKRRGESWDYLCSELLCKRVCKSAFGEHEHKCSRHSNTLSTNQRLFAATAVKVYRSEKRQKVSSLPCLPSPRASVRPSSQETSLPVRTSPRLRKAESPTVPQDQGVGYRVARRRRENQFQ